MQLKVVVALALLVTCSTVFAQQNGAICYNPNLVKDTSKKSIRSMAYAMNGNDSIKIVYHSPGVRKRIIWGGLVPFDEVWVTGAHDATTFDIGSAFVLGGKEIPAGRYALFTIPGETEWTFIVNKHWQQHLASEYDEKDDVVRVTVKPSQVQHTERLQYFIDYISGKDFSIVVAWEKIRIEIPFTVKQ